MPLRTPPLAMLTMLPSPWDSIRGDGDIELERPFESLCPGQLCGFGRFWLVCPVHYVRGGGLRGAFFARFARHDLSSQSAVWCEFLNSRSHSNGVACNVCECVGDWLHP